MTLGYSFVYDVWKKFAVVLDKRKGFAWKDGRGSTVSNSPKLGAEQRIRRTKV
jgi:hypothetical protein